MVVEVVQVLIMEVKQESLVALVEDQLFIQHHLTNVVQVMLVDLIHLKEIMVVKVRVLEQAQPMVVVAEVVQEPLEEMQQVQLVVQVEHDLVHLPYQVLH